MVSVSVFVVNIIYISENYFTSLFHNENNNGSLNSSEDEPCKLRDDRALQKFCYFIQIGFYPNDSMSLICISLHSRGNRDSLTNAIIA